MVREETYEDPRFGLACQNYEEEEWALEKPNLGNARNLRGISFFDPEDGEYYETNKKERT